jgi:hypothetical protein
MVWHLEALHRCLQVVQFVQYGPTWLATLFQLIPSFALFRGLYEMSQYAFLAAINGGPGVEPEVFEVQDVQIAQ